MVRQYLRKARESLASAEADLEAGRFNSAASRAYYAAFQASVAILFENGIRPRGDAWDHRFVINQLSGKLIARGKVVPARFRGTMDRLLKARLVADYRPASVARGAARGYVREARQLVHEITGKLEA
jgi:uncharacterized protein (UPF0332 family)